MARSRFIPDTGLVVRMTSVMFILGGLFVALIVALIFFFPPQYAPFIGLVGIGMAFYQWWTSDKIAMRAMRAREVTPEEAPELHAMIDRLCALADMPKPRVGIAELDAPNAFATGRSPERAVVCVTTGILQILDADELEAVLSHELSHVAHRDVLVMTIASSAGILAGVLMRGAQYGGSSVRRSKGGGAGLLVMVLVSLVVYGISFLLLRLLSRYRELSADRAGAYLTMNPAALASALQKIAGGIGAIPDKDLRSVNSASALCISPFSLKTLAATHPPLEKRLEQLARIQAELSRPT